MEPRNLDAWDNFVRACWHMSRFIREDNAAARLACKKAIELDPHGSGHGDIEYYGDPQVSEHVRGSGNVECRGNEP